MPRNFIIKLPKSKDILKILKATREKWHILHMETPIQLTADFSCEAMEARRVSSAERNDLPSAKFISRGKYPSGMKGK